MQLRTSILWIQGIYTLVTALWPILHIESFMWVSGYKVDVWLVKTVSVLLLAIAVALLLTIYSKEENYPIGVLALFTSAGLAYVDFYYALNDRIWNIYMADGIAEIIFATVWMYLLLSPKKKKKIGS